MDVGLQRLPSSAILLHELGQTVGQALGIAWSCLYLYLQQLCAEHEASLTRCSANCVVSMMPCAQQGGNGVQHAEVVQQKKRKKKLDLIKRHDMKH